MGSLNPGKEEIWGSNPQPSCFCDCKLQQNRQSYSLNTNEELGELATVIPSFAKLLWSLFIYINMTFTFSQMYVNIWNGLLIDTDFSSLARFIWHVNSLELFEFLYIKR